MTKRELAGNCARLRSHIIARAFASHEELIEIWPRLCGCEGLSPCAKCLRARKEAWWETRCQLMKFMGRAEFFSSTTEEAEEEILKAANEEPKRVVLLSLDEVTVYPKCMDALQWFRMHDMGVSLLQTYMDVMSASLEEGWTEQEAEHPFDLIKRTDVEIGLQLRTMCYAACNYGIRVDREEIDSPDFELPELFANIDAIDVARLHKYFYEVNVIRLNYLPYLMGPTKPGEDKRMSWNVFYGTMANQLNSDMRSLMRDRSLVSLLAQVRLATPTIQDLKAS